MIQSDVAAERAVLAGLCSLGSDGYCDVADIIFSPDAFTLGSNQAIWRCLQHIFQNDIKTVDFPSFLSAAHDLGLSDYFSRPTEQDHLGSILRTPVRPETFRRMAGKVRKLEISRSLSRQLDEAKKNLEGVTGDESIDQILSMAEGPVLDFTSLLARPDDRPIRRMGANAEAYINHLMDNPREFIGIPSGFRRYDRAIGGGFRSGAMDIIAARAKQGKSFLSDRFSLNIIPGGIPVLNLDTEMSQEEHLHRIAAMMTGLNLTDIERGVYGKDAKSRDALSRAMRQLQEWPYYYRCITGEPVEETIAHMRRWVLREVGLGEDGRAKPCLIIYDYLKLMDSAGISKGLAEYQAMGFLTSTLKNFANRHGVSLLAFAQLNRDGIDKEDVSAISQSDRIIWFSTSFTIFKRKSDDDLGSEEDGGEAYTHKFVPVVMRHGEGLQPGDYINVKTDLRVGFIEEGPTKYELAAKPQTDKFPVNTKAIRPNRKPRKSDGDAGGAS